MINGVQWFPTFKRDRSQIGEYNYLKGFSHNTQQFDNSLGSYPALAINTLFHLVAAVGWRRLEIVTGQVAQRSTRQPTWYVITRCIAKPN